MNKFTVVTGIVLALGSFSSIAGEVDSRRDDWFAQQRQLTDGATVPRHVRGPGNGASELCRYDRSADEGFRAFWAQLQLTDGVTMAMTQPAPKRYARRSGASGAAGAEKMAMMDCGEMMKQAR